MVVAYCGGVDVVLEDVNVVEGDAEEGVWVEFVGCDWEVEDGLLVGVECGRGLSAGEAAYHWG